MATDNVGVFALLLEDLFWLFPFSVTSWFRSVKHNADEKGKANSKHLRGLAVDVLLDPGVDKVRFLATAKSWGLFYEDEGDHIHIQSLPPDRKKPAPASSISQAGASPEGGGAGGGVPLAEGTEAPIQSEKI